MNNVFRYLRYTAYAVEIFLVFIAQNTPYLVPKIWGGQPLILIPVVLTIAFFEGDTVGLTVGVAAGILIDISAGEAIGLFGILLAIACYVIGLLSANLLKLNILTGSIVSVTAVATIYIVYWFFSFVLAGDQFAVYILVNHILPSMVYTMLFIPIFYYINQVFAFNIYDRDNF